MAATSQEYFDAGLSLYQKQNYSQAVPYFRAAIQLDPQSWKAYQMLGQSYYEMGDSGSALQMFDKSLEIHPANKSLRQFANKLRSATMPGLPESPISSPGGVVVSGPNTERMESGYLGLGLELGDPAGWGVSGKFWLDSTSALQPALKLGDGTVLQLDYLWHDFNVIQPHRGLMPIYFGAGGGLGLGGGVAIEARGVVGISYLFNRADVPVDIYVQLVPALWFGGGGVSNLQFYGNLGSRYYF